MWWKNSPLIGLCRHPFPPPPPRHLAALTSRAPRALRAPCRRIAASCLRCACFPLCEAGELKRSSAKWKITKFVFSCSWWRKDRLCYVMRSRSLSLFYSHFYFLRSSAFNLFLTTACSQLNAWLLVCFERLLFRVSSRRRDLKFVFSFRILDNTGWVVSTNNVPPPDKRKHKLWERGFSGGQEVHFIKPTEAFAPYPKLFTSLRLWLIFWLGVKKGGSKTIHDFWALKSSTLLWYSNKLHLFDWMTLFYKIDLIKSSAVHLY